MRLGLLSKDFSGIEHGLDYRTGPERQELWPALFGWYSFGCILLQRRIAIAGLQAHSEFGNDVPSTQQSNAL